MQRTAIPIVILAGGLGTRLKPCVPDKPKILAPFHRQTYLDILLSFLLAQGFTEVILSLGYRARDVLQHLQDHPSGLTVRTVIEDSPKGTGGAIKQALPLIETSHFFVANGDTFLDIDPDPFWQAYVHSGSSIGMAVVSVPEASAYGTVTLAPDNRVLSFHEKGRQGPGIINAGWYLFAHEPFTRIAADTFSLEYDLLMKTPPLTIQSYPVKSQFFDYGTPDAYQKAQQFFRDSKHDCE